VAGTAQPSVAAFRLTGTDRVAALLRHLVQILILPRYTQPEADQQQLLSQLKLTLPEQPLPRIRSQTTQVA
jgi:hypothetical protein